MTERNRELCKYLETENFEAEERMIDFYLRCRDADMHFADADRYAICNTLFQYDIGMDNARKIDNWMYKHEEEIYELSYQNRELFERAVRELGLNLDFSNWRTKDFEFYEYFNEKEEVNA